MKKIGIIYKSEDRLIKGTAEKLALDLAPSFKVITDLNKIKDSDFVITLGGDGTILRAARIVCPYKIPILAVHLGGLGVLAEIPLSGITDAAEKIRRREYKIDERSMLSANVSKNGRRIKEFLALNDIVICKKHISRTIRLRAYLKDLVLTDYIADGLIAATPTGSTAYNFAALGPILPIKSKSYILSPICPHRGANRAIVLEEPCAVHVVKNEEVLLTADGQETFVVNPEHRIEISPAKEKTRFIRFKDYDLWELLRLKLGFGI